MRFFFLGERLAVDLLNTVVVQDGRVHLLQGPMDVAAWAEAAGGSPPAPQVCEPELSADVLRRIESGTAPLVLHADMRGSGQIPRLLSAAPGERPSWRGQWERVPQQQVGLERARAEAPPRA